MPCLPVKSDRPGGRTASHHAFKHSLPSNRASPNPLQQAIPIWRSADKHRKISTVETGSNPNLQKLVFSIVRLLVEVPKAVVHQL